MRYLSLCFEFNYEKGFNVVIYQQMYIFSVPLSCAQAPQPYLYIEGLGHNYDINLSILPS